MAFYKKKSHPAHWGHGKKHTYRHYQWLGFWRGVVATLSVLVLLVFTPLISYVLLKPLPVAAQKSGEGNEEFYDMVSVFSEVFNRVRSDYVESISAAELVEKAINGMLSRLDPYSAYFNVRDFREFSEQSRGQFGGLGMEVSGDPSGYVKVIAPIDDTPAYRAGVKAGDLITKVEALSVQGKGLDEVVRLMRGDPGTSVSVTFIRQGLVEPFEISLRREKIVVQSVKGELKQGGLGYVRITGFTEQTERGVKRIIRQIKIKNNGVMPKGLVIDLRNNPGGLLDQAIKVSDSFLNQGEIVSIRGRKKADRRRYLATRGDISKGAELVVLVNGGSASASEIFAGAIKDQKRGVVMGTKTFGKGVVQSVFPLSKSGTAMKLTTQEYYTPSGKSIHGEGISPDIEVKEPVETTKSLRSRILGNKQSKTAKDVQLERALKQLRKMVRRAG
ncbi:MAG: S41 family peptidase [Alphaproteobacteria bacterium]